MDQIAKDIENRITRLETEIEHICRIQEDRRLVISAHSRRLADAEGRIHDLTQVQILNSEKLTTNSERLSAITQERRDAKMKSDARMALAQWAASVVMAAGIVVGLLNRGEMKLIETLLSGFVSPPG